MEKARIIQDNIVEIIDFESEAGYMSKETLSKYKDFTRSERPSYDSELQSLKISYIESGNEIREHWEVTTDFSKISKKIEGLKSELSGTDYIIIKSYEAKLAMSDAPYSQEYLEKIIQERQALRDKINELETLLK